MFKTLLYAGAIALAPLFVATSAEAQVVVSTPVATYPTAVGYVPTRTGLFGLRTTMRPVYGGVTTVNAVNYVSPVVTTNYAPATTTYYAPTTATTTYYAPTTATTTYYAPTTTAVVPTTTYYRPAYWYSTPAPTPRTVGMPVIGY